MLTGALTTQLPEEMGNIRDAGLDHSSQETVMSREEGFGRDTLCTILSTANGHSVSCRRRGAATRGVFWSPGKQSHGRAWHLPDQTRPGGMAWSPTWGCSSSLLFFFFLLLVSDPCRFSYVQVPYLAVRPAPCDSSYPARSSGCSWQSMHLMHTGCWSLPEMD